MFFFELEWLNLHGNSMIVLQIYSSEELFEGPPRILVLLGGFFDHQLGWDEKGEGKSDEAALVERGEE